MADPWEEAALLSGIFRSRGKTLIKREPGLVWAGMGGWIGLAGASITFLPSVHREETHSLEHGSPSEGPKLFHPTSSLETKFEFLPSSVFFGVAKGETEA